jgi:transposase
MANQLKMVDVVSILTLHARGWSCRRIARELGVDRDAVSRHVKLSAAAAGGGAQPPGVSKPATEALTGIGVNAEADGSKPASEALTGIIADVGECDSKPATEALAGILAGQEVVSKVGERGAELAPAARSRCAPWRQFIVDQLAAGHSAQRIYQDLVSDHGYVGSYHSVRRLARKLNRAAGGGLPFRRMECSPGDEAQVDFGSGARIVGADGGRHRSHVFRIVLSHSRKGYSEAVDRQTTDNFLRCLENAFHHFGGVPRTLVIDNLRAAVARADWYEPELCPKAASFAAHYGIAILPARPYTPRHKGKVERGIG